MKGHAAAEAKLAAVPVTMREIGLVVSTVGVVVQLAVVNGDAALAAVLCDLITAVALALRSDATTSRGSPRQAAAGRRAPAAGVRRQARARAVIGAARLCRAEPSRAEPRRGAMRLSRRS